MRTATIDVESVGRLPRAAGAAPLEGFEAMRERIGREHAWPQAGEDPEAAADRYLALLAPLSHVVCVGFMSHIRAKDGSWPRRRIAILDGSLVDYEPGDRPALPVQVEADEAAVLAAAADYLGRFDQIVTFNGRNFDVVALLHRMWAKGVKVPAVLQEAVREHRYRAVAHVDLVEQFGFRGMVRHVGPLRAYAAAVLGRDPKAEVHGNGVGDLVAKRDGYTLARYNLGDVEDTGDLFESWARNVGLV